MMHARPNKHETPSAPWALYSAFPYSTAKRTPWDAHPFQRQQKQTVFTNSNVWSLAMCARTVGH
eukprot:6470047-Amphidinium_carterae.1